MHSQFCSRIPYHGGVLAFALISSLGAQTISFQPVPQAVLEQRLNLVKGNNQEREQTLKKLFEEAGCRQIGEPEVKGAATPNLTCTLPGTAKASVIIGAHYDKAARGDGVIDDWAGAALLPSLYESLRETPRRLTLVFVAFTDHQKGLRGSTAFAKSLGGQGPDGVRAMINIDCVGLDPTEIWMKRSDQNLVTELARVAQSLKAPMTLVNRGDSTQVDSDSFADKHIPTIDFHSIRHETATLPNSDKDKLDLVKMADYANTYRLLAGYLAWLDSSSSAPPASAGKK